MIRKKYIKELSKLEKASPFNYYSNLDLNNLARCSRIASRYNTCDSYDLFMPNKNKQYSILNTDDSSSPGTHWISVVQYNNYLFCYDSFARTKNIMKRFEQLMKAKGLIVVFVNQGSDQSSEQTNCGLRCLLWLIFVDKYGLERCIDI